MKRLFCFFGLHWLINHESQFIDRITGNTVYMADCICGKKKFMTDSLFPLAWFRVEKLKAQ